MKRTSMFIAFMLTLALMGSVSFAQCPGGMCGSGYGWGWWPWYTVTPTSQACANGSCRKCVGPACEKVQNQQTVPATTDEPADTAPSQEESPATEPVPAITEGNPSLVTDNQETATEEVTETVEADASLEQAPGGDEPDQPQLAKVCPFTAKVIELINYHRSRVGLPPLQVDLVLVNGCQSHSAWMARYGFQHAYGVGKECIAYGVNTPESLVNMWLNSSGHRAIIMGFGTKIGVGSAGTFHTLRIR